MEYQYQKWKYEMDPIIQGKYLSPVVVVEVKLFSKNRARKHRSNKFNEWIYSVPGVEMEYKTERINVIKNGIIERTYSSREVVAEVEVESEKK